MVSLGQIKKVNELILEHDYVSVENPEHKDLDPMEIPIGGPAMVKSPEGKLFKVYANASVEPYDG